MVNKEYKSQVDLCLLMYGSLITKLCPTLGIPRTAACQAPLSMGFPRQEYWSGLAFPSPEDSPIHGIELPSLHWQANSLPLNHLGKPT